MLSPVVVALALSALPPTLTVPAVGVGEQAPEAAVLHKLTELADDALRRLGVPESGQRPDPGQALVESARAAYYDLKFEAAVRFAEQAISHYEKNPVDLADGQRFLNAHVYAAMAELERGKEKLAQEHMAAALTVRPDLHLLESDFSPMSIAALERARDQHITDRPRGSLTVTTSPAFARVRVDGAVVGESPLTLKGVLVGRHFVSVAMEGHLPQAGWVDVVSAAPAQVSFVVPVSPVEASRRGLAEQVGKGGGPMLEAEARKLGTSAGAQACVLLAVGRARARWVVIAAWVPLEGPAVRAHTTVAEDLVDAPAALEALVKALLAGGAPGPVAVGVAPPAGVLHFEKAWLGLLPPPPRVAVPIPVEPPPVPVYKKPLLWVVVVGGAAAVAGGIVAIAVATRPAPAAQGVKLTLTLPE